MNGDELDTSASFTQLGLSLSSNLTWKTHIHSLAKHASQKLGFLARVRGFFSSSHLLSTYKSQIRPSLGTAPTSGVVLQNLLSVFSTISSPKPFVSSTIPTSPNLSNLFPSLFSWRSFHHLQILSRALFSGGQGYHSYSVEACKNHQKLNSFTPFPSFLIH